MEEGITRKPFLVSGKFRTSRKRIYNYTLDTFEMYPSYACGFADNDYLCPDIFPQRGEYHKYVL